MPNRFLITKVIPVIAILAIYWIGSYDFANIIFLPIAFSLVAITVYITRKYGDKDKSEK
ncbi:hypothetical protein WN093_14380 [Gammaproteobacteria bacterium AS21]